MAHILIAPVQLDVLRLDTELRVAGPLLDFTKLPWAGSVTYKDRPYLSETLAAETFEDQHALQPGLHFHWSLPLALTKTSNIGIVYRQSFQSVFGRAPQASGELSGDDIWSELVGRDWLHVIDDHIGMARTNLPAEEEQVAHLQTTLPRYAHAIRNLLKTSVFPPVPNRWLLSRIVDGQPQTATMIESDYLWPTGQDQFEGRPLAERCTIYPQITDNPEEQPYRYLGRAYELETAHDPAEYLASPLTAAGYGEPAFAAFYPICRSVFGHYDQQLPAVDHEQYELIGWYENPAQDYFQLFVDAFRQTWSTDHQTADNAGMHRQHQQYNYLYIDLLDAIHRQLRIEVPIVVPQADLAAVAPDTARDGAPDHAWEYLQHHLWIDEQGRLLPKAYRKTTIVGEPFQGKANDIRRILNNAIEAQMPERLVCYARCDCIASESTLPASADIKIALGDSPTEALSALLAGALSTNKQSIVEDQLEAIQFASTLQHVTVDTGPIFEALRHEKRFHALPGGRSWGVRAKSQDAASANGVAENAQVTTSINVANQLNRLNTLEEQYARIGAAVASLRRQIFADWCWYLKLESSWRAGQKAPVFREPGDEPRFGSQVGTAAPARRRQPSFGTQVGQTATDTPIPATPAPERESSSAGIEAEFLGGLKRYIANAIENQLAHVLEQEATLKAAIDNQYLATQAALLEQRDESQSILELTPQVGPRFWRANDPVVFISGFDPSPRHQDTRSALATCLVPLDEDVNDIREFRSRLDQLWQDEMNSVPTGEWRPIFLGWDVAFCQAHQQQDETYDQAYLQSHYRLGNTDFEAVQQPVLYDSPISFYGRTILSPGASISLKTTIIGRLVPVIYRQFLDALQQQATVELFTSWLEEHAPLIETQPTDDPDIPAEQQIKQWLADELSGQTNADGQLVQHLLEYLKAESQHPIIRQFLREHSDADLAGDLDPFLDWATARTAIKASFAAQHLSELSEPLEIALVDQDQVRAAFVAYLTELLGESLQRYHDETSTPADQQAQYLEDHYSELINWYQPQVSEALQLVVEIRAYRALLDVRGLGQAMMGFGNALIMRHQAFQLPVYNPFPHDGDDAFTASVRTAVQTANKEAPNENLPFSPWRAGKIGLRELELLDSFGRYWPTDPAAPGAGLGGFLVQSADTLPDVGERPGQEYAVPPRLAQGARLAFRWLAADNDIEEMNDHPASNPICGWVVPNNLDRSLMIYAREGEALGLIDEGGHWRPFPGNRGPVIPADIANAHLAQMVQWLCEQGAEFLADFLSALDLAQEAMEPESFAQHEALALLLGRPLALVRADVRLQLQEPPAINISQLKLQADVQAAGAAGAQGVLPPPRHTFGFEQVQVPLRLGEFRRLNDGLAGYWLEDNAGRYAENSFYAVQTSPTPGLNSRIKTRHQANSDDRDESQFLIVLALNDTQPRTVSMLLDPRAPIHAATGILPVAALAIPQDQYQVALQRMQVAFLTAPLLAPDLGLELSLPTEPGFDWSWFQLDGQHWSTISAAGMVHKHQLKDLFGAGVELLWSVLLQQGWLEALSDDTARLVPQDQRLQADLPQPFDRAQEAVELLFHRLRIRPFDPMARFDTSYQLREGWLRLRPAKS